MARSATSDKLLTNLGYILVVVALIAVGILAAHAAHMLMWSNTTDSSMLTLVLVVGATLPGLLFLVVSGRAFKVHGRGLDLEVGGETAAIAEEVGTEVPELDLDRVPDVASFLQTLGPGIEPLLKVKIGTATGKAQELKRTLDLMDRSGHSPSVVALIGDQEKVVGQIDTRSFRHSLSGADPDSRDLIAAIEGGNPGRLRKNWLVSSVLTPSSARGKALGHMVGEKLDVMVLKDKDGHVGHIVDRRALADRVLEDSLATQIS